MVISELIKRLANIKEHCGDLEVFLLYKDPELDITATVTNMKDLAIMRKGPVNEPCELVVLSNAVFVPSEVVREDGEESIMNVTDKNSDEEQGP